MNRAVIPYTTSALLMLFGIFPFVYDDFSKPSVTWSLLFTANIAYPFLIMSFGASTFRYYFKNNFTKWLVNNRRYTGISYGLSFILHYLVITLYIYLFPHPFISTITWDLIVVGPIVLIVTIFMTVTSNNYWVHRLRPKLWTRLHRAGGYVLVCAFIISYFVKHPKIYLIPYALIGFLLLGLRIARNHSERQARLRSR